MMMIVSHAPSTNFASRMITSAAPVATAPNPLIASLNLEDHAPPSAIVPVERWDRLAQRALQVAARLSPDVLALHLTDLEGPEVHEHEAWLRRDWACFVERPAIAAGLPPPRLVIESSPYRSVLAPLLRHIAEQRRLWPDRPVLVVLSELAGGHWWDAALHTHRAKRLRTRVLRHGGPDVSVLIVPWQLEPPQPELVLAEEEPVEGDQPSPARV